VCNYLEGGCKEDRARLCSVVPSDGTRGNGHTLNVRRRFVTGRMAEHWHRLPGEVVESPSFGDLWKLPGCGPGQLTLGGPASARWLDQMISRPPCQPQPFCD